MNENRLSRVVFNNQTAHSGSYCDFQLNRDQGPVFKLPIMIFSFAPVGIIEIVLVRRTEQLVNHDLNLIFEFFYFRGLKSAVHPQVYQRIK